MCSSTSSAFKPSAKALDTGLSEPRRVRGTSYASLTSCPKNRLQAKRQVPVTVPREALHPNRSPLILLVQSKHTAFNGVVVRVSKHLCS